MTVRIYIIGVFALLSAGCSSIQISNNHSRPGYEIVAHDDERVAGSLSVGLLGNTNVLVSNGQHSLLVDGFFTRSGLLASLGGIAPDKNQLKAAVARYNITGLEAIFVSHSHFDHGMDAPALAALTGAEVVGSTSTRCLVAGYDQRQPDPAACSVETRLFHDLGRNKDGEWGNERFEVRLFVTNHGGGRRFLSSTLNRHLGGYIDEPVVGFIFTEQGLSDELTFSGGRITPIAR